MPKGVDYTSGYDQIDQGDAQEITFASALDGQRFAGVTTAPALHDVRFTMTGLIIDAELSNDEWMSVLDTIEAVQSAHQWHYGDWLQYGVKRKYGQTGKQMEAITERTGKDYDTLQGYYNTARLFEFPMRIGNCSFEVHKVIAKAFPGDTQGDEKKPPGMAPGRGNGKVRRSHPPSPDLSVTRPGGDYPISTTGQEYGDGR